MILDQSCLNSYRLSKLLCFNFALWDIKALVQLSIKMILTIQEYHISLWFLWLKHILNSFQSHERGKEMNDPNEVSEIDRWLKHLSKLGLLTSDLLGSYKKNRSIDLFFLLFLNMHDLFNPTVIPSGSSFFSDEPSGPVQFW
jgi:hypothetical protein